MNTHTDLMGLEKKAYESTWDDGLLDVFVGFSLLGLGIFWLTDYAVFGGLIPVLLVPIWPGVRSKITVPRAGSVKFGAARRAKERRNLTTLFLAGAATMLLGVVLYFTVARGAESSAAWPTIVIPALPGVLLAAAASFAGNMIGAQRFYVYAGLLLVGAAIGVWLDLEPGVYLAASGAVVLATGIVMVVRFIREYPIHEEIEL